jgi:hypothetical protein
MYIWIFGIVLWWNMSSHVAGLWINFLGALTKLWKETVSFVKSVWLPVLPRGTTQLHWKRFSWNLVFEYIFWKCVKKFKFCYNVTRISCTVLEDLCTFMIISHWILRVRNVLEESCRENKNTCFMFSVCVCVCVCIILWNVASGDYRCCTVTIVAVRCQRVNTALLRRHSYHNGSSSGALHCSSCQ